MIWLLWNEKMAQKLRDPVYRDPYSEMLWQTDLRGPIGYLSQQV